MTNARVSDFTSKFQNDDSKGPRHWIDASVTPMIEAMRELYPESDIKLEIINDTSVAISFGLLADAGVDEVRLNLSSKISPEGQLSFAYQGVKSFSEGYVRGADNLIDISGETTLEGLIEMQNPLLIQAIGVAQESHQDSNGMSNA